MKPRYRIALSLLCLALTAGCADRGAEQEAGSHDSHAAHQPDSAESASHAGHESIEAAKASDQSLYQLESEWQTQTGTKVKLGAFGGKPLVLAMVYASCKNACPRIIADMKRIQAEAGKGTQFALVSIDPEVDTPARLAELARKSKLDDQWLLLRGTPDDVLELAALLGVKYRKISAKDYAHTNLISVLDAKGEIAHRQQGLGVDPAQSIAALKALR